MLAIRRHPFSHPRRHPNASPSSPQAAQLHGGLWWAQEGWPSTLFHSLFASEALKLSPLALSFGIVSALGFPYFTLFSLPLFQSVSDPHSRAPLKPHTLSFLQVSLFDPFSSIQNTQSLWLLQQNINLRLRIDDVEKRSHTRSPS